MRCARIGDLDVAQNGYSWIRGKGYELVGLTFLRISDGSPRPSIGIVQLRRPTKSPIMLREAVESGYNPGARMNYYEELGIPKTAPAEEVRLAYRSLARLLHPDQQPDETLRRLAGLQMTRLNEILQTLTNSALRREYNQGLRRQAGGGGIWTHGFSSGPPAPLARPTVRWSSLTWLCATLVAFGVFVVFLAHDTGTQQLASEGNILRGAAQDDVAGARSNWASGHTAPGKRRPSGEGGLQAEGELAANDSAGPNSPLWSAKSRFMAFGLDTIDSRLFEAGFGGEWFYAKPAKRAESQDFYPPEYIDVEISAPPESVKGRYSAKYSVGGRQLWPFVFFEFGGGARPPSAELKWSGSGGAAGHVRLTLLSARSLRVDWSTDQPNEEQSLISGTATLLRRESPYTRF